MKMIPPATIIKTKNAKMFPIITPLLKPPPSFPSSGTSTFVCSVISILPAEVSEKCSIVAVRILMEGDGSIEFKMVTTEGRLDDLRLIVVITLFDVTNLLLVIKLAGIRIVLGIANIVVVNV